MSRTFHLDDFGVHLYLELAYFYRQAHVNWSLSVEDASHELCVSRGA